MKLCHFHEISQTQKAKYCTFHSDVKSRPKMMMMMMGMGHELKMGTFWWEN
jgi:hypothetical protein